MEKNYRKSLRLARDHQTLSRAVGQAIPEARVPGFIPGLFIELVMSTQQGTEGKSLP